MRTLFRIRTRGSPMSHLPIVRWGGLAAMLVGVAFIVLVLIPKARDGSPFYIFGSVLLFVAVWLLLLVALAGFHALQKEHYGRIGRAGFYTVIVGASAMIVIQLLTWVGVTLGITALVFPDPVGLFRDGRVGALRGSHLASEGVAPLVRGRAYRRRAGIDRSICGLRRVWGDAWGDIVRAPLAGTGLRTLV